MKSASKKIETHKLFGITVYTKTSQNIEYLTEEDPTSELYIDLTVNEMKNRNSVINKKE